MNVQLLIDQTKKIFECFICFWKRFLSLLFRIFFSKSQKFLFEKLSVWIFHDSSCEWMQSYQSREMKRENLVPLKNQAKSFTTWLRVVHNLSLTYEMKMMKFQFLHKFRQRVSLLTCKCFATQTCPSKFAMCILYILQVTHEWLVSHWLA